MRRISSNDSFIQQTYKNLYKTVVGDIQADTINFLNNQKFKINKTMLDFLLSEFYNENSLIFQGCNKLHPLTDKLDELKKEPENKKQVNLILANNSKYFLHKNILEIAIIFENITFYLPTFMDFRGRIYPYPHYLYYQGSDIARCLIEFAEGCDIDSTNINIVYQYLANTAGKNKLTIENKIK
jgi:DNA-directed RNA polymerase